MSKISRFFLISPLALQTAIWPFVWPALRFFCHLKILGLENLDGLKKGVIFAANHSSPLDPIILPASLPFLSRFMPIFYTSKERSFYKTSYFWKIFFGGVFFKLWGAHRLNSGSKDYAVSLSAHEEILKRKHSLLIFPEGGIQYDGLLHAENAHGGAAYLSEKTGLPIVPVFISGVFKNTWKEFFLRQRHAIIAFGRPIYVKDVMKNLPADPTRYKIASRFVLEHLPVKQPF